MMFSFYLEFRDDNVVCKFVWMYKISFVKVVFYSLYVMIWKLLLNFRRN